MACTIGFTYDLKSDHRGPRPGAPEDDLAELDVEETVALVERMLASGGHRVVRIGNVHNLLDRLPDPKVDIVFNICEGMGHRSREAEVPMLLDLYGIPYVGSDGLTLALTLDKVMAKKVFVADGVPTPRFFLANGSLPPDALKGMRFPLIVKPCHEGSSKGISDESVVRGKKDLKPQIDAVHRLYRQPAVVEEFIRGSEFTVLVVGNETPEALEPVQIQIAGKRELGDMLYTWRRLTSTDIVYLCPAKIPARLRRALLKASVEAYRAVGCRDFGRVDFRVDEKGRPFVLEVNPLPSLSDEDVFPLIAQAHGWTFEGLLLKIVDFALERHGIR
ncbi:MAG: D-alanine--D-alanine ligase family protein [Deltaproteobacteria bacterium]